MTLQLHRRDARGDLARRSTLTRWLSCGAVCLMLAAQAAGAAELAPFRVVSGNLPPFAIADGKEERGALVEIVEQLGADVGNSIKVEFFPWKRATVLPLSLPRVAVFPLTRTPEREQQYRWLAKLYYQQFVFVARHGSKVDVHDVDSLKKLHVVVLRGSPHLKYLLDHGFQHVSEETSVEEMQRMLQLGIADVICGADAVERAAFQLANKPLQDYDFSTPQTTGEIWLAGSADFTQADIDAFHAAMVRMMENGSYGRILRKYHLAK